MKIRSENSRTLVRNIVFGGFSAFSIIFLHVVGAHGQTAEIKVVNNPYSPSPASKVKITETLAKPRSSETVRIADITVAINRPNEKTSESLSRQLIQPSVTTTQFSEFDPKPPTDIYKVGIGDVLFINLKNTPQGSGFYTVRDDGTIDYPLAGDDVSVLGQTTESIGQILRSGVSLFSNPEFEVKVREYSSHKINVKGAVDHPGEKSIQREAVPLYVIRAEAGVDPKAKKVVIQRAPFLAPESYALNAEATDKLLIGSGTSVEFVADLERTAIVQDHYFISGDLSSAGQRDLRPGLTLYQAAIEANIAKGLPKRAIIRRKQGDGSIRSYEYDLKSIKDGRTPDPSLKPGDMVEIRN